MTSRDRFELGLFEARAAINGNLGGSQMTVCNCMGPQNGEPACPCAMNQQRHFFAQFGRKFFNTTKLEGAELAQS